ncbi:hypothetical protein ABT369_26440 [Dactylosporangium sp. NPDC000244]|uniref:hypothetical protein n=1 Tax=Dactylosporangium sp. NPDC000244 TaxID=3154365 RepID=UPI00331D923E
MTSFTTTRASRCQSWRIAAAGAAILLTLTTIPAAALCKRAFGGGNPAISPNLPPPSSPPSGPACAAPSDLVPPTPTNSRTGPNPDQRAMLNLAAQLHESADDTSTGDHTYLRYGLQTAASASHTGTGSTVATFRTVDYKYLIGDDRSGTGTVTRYPVAEQGPQPGSPGAVTEHHIYRAHRIFPIFPTPFAGNPTAAPVPSSDPDHPTASDVIRDTVALTAATNQPCPRRVLMLTILAAYGAVYRGPSNDRAGRPGIAITADNPEHTTRDTLIVDAATGTVLAHQQQAIAGPATRGSATTQTTLVVTSYANRRTAVAGVDGSTPTAPAPQQTHAQPPRYRRSRQHRRPGTPVRSHATSDSAWSQQSRSRLGTVRDSRTPRRRRVIGLC